MVKKGSGQAKFIASSVLALFAALFLVSFAYADISTYQCQRLYEGPQDYKIYFTGCGDSIQCLGSSGDTDNYFTMFATVPSSIACPSGSGSGGCDVTNRVAANWKSYPALNIIAGGAGHSAGCVNPPICPSSQYSVFDKTITSYCSYNNSVYSAAGTPEIPVVTCSKSAYDTQTCGDWKMFGPGAYTVFGNTPTNIKGASDMLPSDTAGNDNVYTGRYIFSTWFYLDRDMPDLSLGGRIDDTITVDLWSLDGSTLKSVTSFPSGNQGTCGGSDCGDPSSSYNIVFPKLSGGTWYFIRITYEDFGGNDYVLASLRNKGNTVNTDTVFKIVNSGGPVLVDPDYNSTFCTSQIGFVGAWSPDTTIYDRHCCGDDPEDFGYVNSKGEICSLDQTSTSKKPVWSAATNKQRCINSTGNFIDNTEFSTDIFHSTSYVLNSQNGSDGCCGDDNLAYTLSNIFSQDYGFINTPSNKFLCYNYIADKNIKNTDHGKDVWSWLNAEQSDTRFKIFTLDNDRKTADVISNGKNWSYCNANPSITIGLSGTAIKEGDSFQPQFSNGEMSCSALLSTIFSPRVFTDASTCTGVADCCLIDNTNLIMSVHTASTNDIYSSCGQCIGADGSTYIFHDAPGGNFCAAKATNPVYAQFCGTSDPLIITVPDGPIYKTACAYDFSDCMKTNIYDTDKSCAGNGGVACDIQSNICTGLTVTATDLSDGQTCCINPDVTPQCKQKAPSTIIDATTCRAAAGEYINTTAKSCIGFNVTISDTSACCFYKSYSIGDFTLGRWSTRISPDAFTCFKENDNNVIAQCVFDNKGANFGMASTSRLDSSDGHLASNGVATHTLISWDEFDSSTGIVSDKVMRLSVIASSPGSKTGSTNFKTVSTKDGYRSNFSLVGYSTLEFNVAYSSSISPVFTLMMTNRYSKETKEYSIPLSEILALGSKNMRWNHAILNLSKLPRDMTSDDMVYYSFYFSGNTDDVIVVDNFMLVPVTASDLSHNTQNKYCTGGFGTWIDTLNPPAGTDFSQLSSYGPYQFACEAQGAFDWTGEHCCGYNTRFNYGEFYSDTTKGCFDGSKIQNDWTASYINNVREGTPGFESYQYKDILYSGDKFIACQADFTSASGKYSKLYVSYDGTGTDQKQTLITKTVNGQCSVVGSYYCADGAWRQSIPGYTGAINEALKLKPASAPSGVNLIHNGGFDT